jgi:sarcosine oxidase/L-pipecolate oxidase
LPTIGTYIVNVLNGKSNGEEKDKAWKWKREWADRGAHEKVMPKGELSDFEDASRPKARL